MEKHVTEGCCSKIHESVGWEHKLVVVLGKVEDGVAGWHGLVFLDVGAAKSS